VKQTQLSKEFLINFEEKLPIIVHYFTKVYGEKHREIIEERLKDIFVAFKGTDEQFLDACHKSEVYQNKDTRKISSVSKYVIDGKDVNLPSFEEFLSMQEGEVKTIFGFGEYTKEEIGFLLCLKNLHSNMEDLKEKLRFDEAFIVAIDNLLTQKVGKGLTEEEREVFKVAISLDEAKIKGLEILIAMRLLGHTLDEDINSLSDQEIEKIKAFIASDIAIRLPSPYYQSMSIANAVDIIIENHKKVSSHKDKCLIMQDSKDFMMSIIGSEALLPELQIQTILERSESLFVPVLKAEGKGVFKYAVYNLAELCDSVIVHELDHAINMSIQKGDGFITDYSVYQGISKIDHRKSAGLDKKGDYVADLISKVYDKKEFKAFLRKYYPQEDKPNALLPDFKKMAEDLTFFNEVCTDFRAIKVAEAMKKDGVVLFDSDRKVKSTYSLAFSGCDYMFDQLLPYITDCTVCNNIDALLDIIGIENFIKITYHIAQLGRIDHTKCSTNLADLYYNYQAGVYVLGNREFTKEEEQYLKHTEQVNGLIEEALEKLGKKKGLLDSLWETASRGR